MSVLDFMHRLKNWIVKRDEKVMDADHRVAENQWLDQTLHVTHDYRRESITQKVRRTSSTIRRLSTVGIKGDKGPNNEDCKHLASEMCPNGKTDPMTNIKVRLLLQPPFKCLDIQSAGNFSYTITPETLATTDTRD